MRTNAINPPMLGGSYAIQQFNSLLLNQKVMYFPLTEKKGEYHA